MDGGAWWATVHGITKELDTAEQLHFKRSGAGLPSGGHSAGGTAAAGSHRSQLSPPVRLSRPPAPGRSPLPLAPPTSPCSPGSQACLTPSTDITASAPRRGPRGGFAPGPGAPQLPPAEPVRPCPVPGAERAETHMAWPVAQPALCPGPPAAQPVHLQDRLRRRPAGLPRLPHPFPPADGDLGHLGAPVWPWPP